MNPTFLQASDEGVILAVRAAPKAAQSRIAGVHGQELKVFLHSPPVDGQANKELVQLLAKTFSLPKSQIRILSGENSRSKKILLSGMEKRAIENRLAEIV
ncbi:MAG: DUF167 domain-containing protein [Candidatus Omnitrophota bacterium]